MKIVSRHDVFTTVFLGIWTTGWLAFLVYSLRKGSINYNSQHASGATYTAEGNPVGFYLLIAVATALVCLGLRLMFVTLPSKSDSART